MRKFLPLKKKYFLVLIFILPILGYGQDSKDILLSQNRSIDLVCVNPPTVTLNGVSGNACVGTPFVLNGNTFGGSATNVTISHNGAGVVSTGVIAASPFSFSYTPSAADAGNVITLTATTNNPAGGTCVPAVDTFQLTVNPAPTLVITNPQTVCTGSSVNLTAPAVTAGSSPGALTYWTNATATTPLANPSAVSVSGTYYIKLTSAQGCVTIQPVTANINPPPTGTPNLFWDQANTNATSVAFDFNNNIGETGFFISYSIDGAAPVTLNYSTPSHYNVPITPGQCVVFTLTWLGTCAAPMTSSNIRTPVFNAAIPTVVCASNIPALPTSTNVPGAWSPATITTSGVYTYVPSGATCASQVTANITVNPVATPVFPASLTFPVCSGSAAPSLPASDNNGITGTWSPTTVSNTTSGNYTFTPSAGQCATTKTINITVSPSPTPVFNGLNSPLPICSNGTVPTLPTTSSNGVNGTWSPAAISNTVGGSYTFTPTTGQCASVKTLTVNIIQPVAIDYPANLNICQGNSASPLGQPSNAAGTWSPATISTTTAGTFNYTFTATPGQCLTSQTFNYTVNVLPVLVPDFPPIAPFCAGSTVPILGSTSPNGIIGTWSPAAINNMTSGSYLFTPTPSSSQCAATQTLSVTVTPQPTPVFNPITPFCSGSVAPLLQPISNNGFTGTWSPATIDNTLSATYTFTPDAGQCAAIGTLNVAVIQPVSPGFTDLEICSGTPSPSLDTLSPIGIFGTWNPVAIDNLNSGSYTFTPNSNQCANPQTINVTVNEQTLSSVNTIVSGAFSENSTITVLALDAGNYLYQVDFGQIQQSNVFQHVPSGTHTVTVYDANGCAPPITVSDVLVIGYPLFFTPNGDSINDFWNVIGLKEPARIYIFDRYGKLLKQISPESPGWDGNYNGQPLPSTDYWFKVEYNENSASKEFKAHFSLKR